MRLRDSIKRMGNMYKLTLRLRNEKDRRYLSIIKRRFNYRTNEEAISELLAEKVASLF